ncbi:hypothetical protein [Parahaliea aestuarii]|uniref:O-antigen ligase family protein n=1 Tax=Parahaliea aestuarii TaxID=1852021 RepID=A0A5C8ZPN7_9GAMM|nr:hypothetical protein [Parahaliea aestuarii]TXS90463.1 hypothetical protein FVW59_14065 [Parahaliea aestuarii]
MLTLSSRDPLTGLPAPGLLRSKPGALGAALYTLLFLKLLISFSVQLGILGALNYALDLLMMPLVGLALAVYWQRLGEEAKICVGGLLCFTLYLVVQGAFYHRPGATVIYYTRFVLPLLLYFALMLCAVNHRHASARITENMVALVFVLGFAGLLFMPDNVNHEQTKLPTYFGNLHKAAYIFSVALIIGTLCYRAQARGRQLLLLGMMLFGVFMLLVGWSIRTPLVLLAVYFGILYLSRFGATGKATLYLLVPAAILSLALLSTEVIDWNRISSGRLHMWQVKLQMLSSADLSQLVFGRGFGSDYIEVANWFGEKDSHNNYLQTVTELGVVGLLLLIANLVLLYRVQPNRHGRALVLAYIATGLFSNGIIYRLLPGYLVAVALAYIALAQAARPPNHSIYTGHKGRP